MNYRKISTLSFLFITTIYAQSAFAVSEGVVFFCDQQNQILKVEHILEPPNGFWKKHRSTGIDFSDLLVIKKDRVIKHKTKTFHCNFKDTSIKVTIEPQPFNDDIQGACGAAVTGAITIVKNGKTVLNREPFDTSPDCIVGGSEIIKTIKMRSGDNAPKVKYIKKPDL